jgi:hypothetical protein
MKLSASIIRPCSRVIQELLCQSFGILVVLLLGIHCVDAQIGDDTIRSSTSGLTEEQIVDYSANYFSKYKPNTALDMVQQVPGFVLDDINKNRGYGASAGNVLINGRRPSSKEDLLSAILGRISASQVERVELIRGQVRGVDLRGHTVIANVVLLDNSPAVVRWEAGVRRNTIVERLLFRGNISVSDNWNGIDYNLGLSGERSSTGENSPEAVFNGANILTEKRFDDSVERGIKSSGNMNASTWVGETLFQINSKLSITTEEEPKDSRRTPQIPGSEVRTELFLDDRIDRELELGINAERFVNIDLLAKLIFLYSYRDNSNNSSQTSINADGDRTLFRISDSNRDANEAIARLELNWTGMPAHAIQANMEGAYNSLDSSQVQTEDTGGSPINIIVPGANTRVEEVRGDFLLRDTWSIGYFELDYGLGAEVSRISQSGDENLERNFFFIKPHSVLTYSPEQDRQTRIRLAREVSQLNFNDFVSASIFQDDDLALGNPNLRPDTSWILEASHERRFGRESVIKLTAFHHWIANVQDLLPITSTFEAPGNIGNGRRWGLVLESTLPLQWMGLVGAKLNIKARWQDSIVVDPVTGKNRVLSGEKGFGGNPYISFNNENRYVVILDYRQDFEVAKVAWGVNMASRAKRPLFNVNELDVYDEGVALNAFIETTRWLGLKLRLIGENLTDLAQVRDRTIYTGERDLSAVGKRELSEELEGIRITFAMSGSFQ